MLLFITILLTSILLTLCLPYKNDLEAKGVLLLDSITFPKVIPNDNYDMVILVTNKKQIGDYGTDSLRSDFFSFAKKANTEGESESVVFGQIIVNGADNLMLAERLGAETDFIHPFLVIIPAGTKESIIYPKTEPYTIKALSRFVTKNTKFHYEMPGILNNYDNFAREFMENDNLTTRNEILKKCEDELTKITNDAELEIANYYIKLMKKLLKNGNDYIKKEITRLEKLLSDSNQMTSAKRRTLERHLNVLHHFDSFDNSKNNNNEL